MNTRHPKPWKVALLTWLCIYPLINLIFLTLMPLIGQWPLLLRTSVASVILVPLMGFALRWLQVRFNGWLHR